ncbi:MAG: aconitate hydratase AcnA [bacterium]|nr:aconitate hydratase AcnA [bacterium]
MKKEDFLDKFEIKGSTYYYYNLEKLETSGFNIERLPFSIKILVENILRKLDGKVVTEDALNAAAGWKGKYDQPVEIPYHPARVLMQDFTGVPAVVDLAVMRDVVKEHGKDPALVNPMVPVDLVVDHSVQIDYFGTTDALAKNVAKEYERNRERYMVLKWAQKNFANFNVVPPNSGICHQVNLEYLGKVVMVEKKEDKTVAFPDTLVGTDSHTPMINGLGVMGWGVGGIEAEAVLLGQPYYMPLPEVIGVKMEGRLKEGVTTTDLVLTITQLLRKHKVVGKFVEYFGPGMKELTVPERATISNMTPEHGATLGLFPVDEKTIAYMQMTNRDEQAEIVEKYAKENGFFYSGEEGKDPEYTEILELDLSTVEPSLAGPSRPQDRVALKDMKTTFNNILESAGETKKNIDIDLNGKHVTIADGSVVIASITSCTNTSNPFIMLGAGLVAKKAVQKGLKVSPFVKTSLAPGSKVVVDYLERAGLMPYFEALGFHLAGFGCTTCIGNSGPLHPTIEKTINENKLTAASVLSGNRNFEARVHQKVRANFLASPMLVVVFALAGRVDVDLASEPVGIDPNGKEVFLKDIWPETHEVEQLIHQAVKKEFYEKEYSVIYEGDENWKKLSVPEETVFKWDDRSTYTRKPPFFKDFAPDNLPSGDINNAKILLLLGDTITTDHISPAGGIPAEYPAGKYLMENNIKPADFNSYGSRRGNHEVMMRGTFANVRIKNRFVAPKEGGLTVKLPQGEEMYVFDAAMKYEAEGVPLVVIGGKEYGTGSSRDWAAKGTMLLGVKAVIAESYERIHRSNLVGMGVLPLVFTEGQNSQSLGLDGYETYSITGIGDITPRKTFKVTAVKTDGSTTAFDVTARLDTEVEVEYFKSSGILQYVLKKLLKNKED